jgi:hypothetical protein
MRAAFAVAVGYGRRIEAGRHDGLGDRGRFMGTARTAEHSADV